MTQTWRFYFQRFRITLKTAVISSAVVKMKEQTHSNVFDLPRVKLWFLLDIYQLRQGHLDSVFSWPHRTRISARKTGRGIQGRKTVRISVLIAWVSSFTEFYWNNKSQNTFDFWQFEYRQGARWSELLPVPANTSAPNATESSVFNFLHG